MEQAMKQHGAFSWNELMTSDIEAAKSFYGKLLGWTMEDMPACEMGYTMAKSDDQEAAGIMGIPKDFSEMPPSWGCYVTVKDVEAQAKLAVKLGGKIILEPQDIPEVGRFTVISDPQGAILSLITYFDKK